MRALVIDKIESLTLKREPLKLVEIDNPKPLENEILIRVRACGICHTEIDEIEGRVLPTFLPIIPGHQVVGEVVETGKDVRRFKIGDRVGAGWIYSVCGKCEFCQKGFENLCENFKATGKDANGGYAEYFKIEEDFAFHIPENFTYNESAPLFCAGAIGYRSLILAEPQNGQNIGLIGFGASGHLVMKMIRYLYPDSRVFVFARDENQRLLSIKLGAYWAGDINQNPPERLNSAIDTTPVWKPPLSILRYLKPAGRLVINAIRKEEHDKFEFTRIDYSKDLWLEKEIKTVANVTRKDIGDFLKIASEAELIPEIETYRFEDANKALLDIKNRNIKGAKVLIIGG